MKVVAFFSSLLLLMFLASCTPEPEEIIIDSSQPQGTFVAQKAGTIVEQNGSGSTGAAELGEDGEASSFLRFGSDFVTNLGTGTVTVYLSTSEDFVADPANGNPDLLLVGPIKGNGENFLKLSPAPASKFTHVILWCGSANVPFGYAALN